MGAMAIHLANVWLAGQYQGDPCTWYLINFLLGRKKYWYYLYYNLLYFRFFNGSFNNICWDPIVSVSIPSKRLGSDQFWRVWKTTQCECLVDTMLPVCQSNGDCKSVNNAFHATRLLGKCKGLYTEPY